METRKMRHLNWKSILMAILAIGLLAGTVNAAAYTWTGGTSSAWNYSGNWTGGTFPSSYTDQATIGTSTKNPVTISTSALAGNAGGTALTINGTAGATALDISSTGSLGMQGGISSTKGITIEGTLRQDGAAGSSYSFAGTGGTITLNGGTISSASGGIWAFTKPVSGYGVISAPFTNTSTGITATSVGNSLIITGSSAAAGTFKNTTVGAVLSLQSYLTSPSLGGLTGEVDLNGATINGTTLSTAGTIYVTGNSTLAGTIARNQYVAFNITGTNTLNFFNCKFSGVSGGPAQTMNIGAGTLNNSGSQTGIGYGIGTGDPITIAGGKITNTGGGTFAIFTPLSGYGTISATTTIGNTINAKGGTLTLDATGGSIYTNPKGDGGFQMFTNGSVGDVLYLKGTIDCGFGSSIYTNNGGGGGNGLIILDGATLKCNPTADINPNPMGTGYAGAVNVVNNSNVNGNYLTGADISISNAKIFSLAGTSTIMVGSGSISNSGTFAIGSGTMSNYNPATYPIVGNGLTTLAGGVISCYSSLGGFLSTNNLDGYGTVTGIFTNNYKVTADGGGTEQTLSFTTSATSTLTSTGLNGWYAKQHGLLSFAPAAVTGVGYYTFGGDPETNKLVNSVALNFNGTVTPGTMGVALLSLDRVDVPAGLVNPIAVFQFSPAGGLSFTSADLTVRYDDVAAAALSLGSGQTLGLYHYAAGTWTQVAGTTLDPVNFLLSAPGLTSFSLYAIAPITAATTYTGTEQDLPANGGTITLLGGPYTTFTSGQIVGILATADAGYTFAGWNVNGPSTLSNSAAASTSLTVFGNFTLTADFTAIVYAVNGVANPTAGGTVAVGSATGTIGQVVSISQTTNPGYTFAGWSLNDGNNGAAFNSGSTAVIIGSNSVTVTASFTAAAGTFNVSATTPSHWVFQNTVATTKNRHAVPLTMAVSGDTWGNTSYTATVTVSPTPSGTYQGLIVSSTSISKLGAGSLTPTNTCAITGENGSATLFLVGGPVLSGGQVTSALNKSVTKVVGQPTSGQYTVSVAVAGNVGGTVTASPVTITLLLLGDVRANGLITGTNASYVNLYLGSSPKTVPSQVGSGSPDGWADPSLMDITGQGTIIGTDASLINLIVGGSSL